MYIDGSLAAVIDRAPSYLRRTDVMHNRETVGGYKYSDASLSAANLELLPSVIRILEMRAWPEGSRRLFEIGCGNGAVADALSRHGYDVVGIDTSNEGIALANSKLPHLSLELGSAYDDLAAKYGRFPVVMSLEVIEHLYFPRIFAHTLFRLLMPGGTAIVSTPYHGYLKNLALSLTGRMDAHFTALWDHGHIKFWSRATISRLFSEVGLTIDRIYRVGRIPPLARSMIVVATRPKA